MISKLKAYSVNPDRLSLTVSLDSKSYARNNNTIPSKKSNIYKALLQSVTGNSSNKPQVSYAELIAHGISVLILHPLINNVYQLARPTIILKSLDRGGAVVTYEVFMGIYLFTVKVLNVEYTSNTFREKCSYQDEPIRVQMTDTQSYIANKKYFTHKGPLINGSQELSKRCKTLKNQEFNDYLKELCIAKLCSALKVGPALKKPLGFDLIRFIDCMEYHTEMLDDINSEMLQTSSLLIQERLKECVNIMHSINIIHGNITLQNVKYSPNQKLFIIDGFSASHFVRETRGFETAVAEVNHIDIADQIIRSIDYYYEDCIQLKQLLEQIIQLTPICEKHNILPRQKRLQFDYLIEQLCQIYMNGSSIEDLDKIGTHPLFNKFAKYFPEASSNPRQPIIYNLQFIAQSVQISEDVEPFIKLQLIKDSNGIKLLTRIEEVTRIDDPKTYLSLAVTHLIAHRHIKYKQMIHTFFKSNTIFTKEAMVFLKESLKLTFISALWNPTQNFQDLDKHIKEIYSINIIATSKAKDTLDCLSFLISEDITLETVCTRLEMWKDDSYFLELMLFILFSHKYYDIVMSLIEKHNIHSMVATLIKHRIYQATLTVEQSKSYLLQELKQPRWLDNPHVLIEWFNIMFEYVHWYDKPQETIISLFDSLEVPLSSLNLYYLIGLCQLLLRGTATKQEMMNFEFVIIESNTIFYFMSSHRALNQLLVTDSYVSRNHILKKRLIQRSILLRSHGEMIMLLDSENQRGVIRFYYLQAEFEFQYHNMAKCKYFIYKYLKAIDKHTSQTLQGVISLLRSLTMVKPIYKKLSDLKRYQDKQPDEQFDYRKQLDAISLTLNADPCTSSMLLLAYLEVQEKRYDRCMYYLKMSLVTNNRDEGKYQFLTKSEALQWLTQMSINLRLLKSAKKYLQMMEAEFEKQPLHSYNRLSHLYRIMNMCELMNDWQRMDKYINVIGNLVNDCLVNDLRIFEKMLSRLFAKERYQMLLKLISLIKIENSQIALFYEGISLYKSKKIHKSLKCLLQLQKMPQPKKSLNNVTMRADSCGFLAQIYDDMSEIMLMEEFQNKALEMYKQAVQIQPNDIYANHQISVYCMKINQHHTALLHLRKVLYLIQYDESLHNQIFIYERDAANCCLKLGQLKESIYHLRRCASLQTDPYVLFHLAKCYLDDRNNKLFYQAASKLRVIDDNQMYNKNLYKLLKEKRESIKMLMLYNKLPKQHLENPKIIRILKNLHNQSTMIDKSQSFSEHNAQIMLYKQIERDCLLMQPKNLNIATKANKMRKLLQMVA